MKVSLAVPRGILSRLKTENSAPGKKEVIVLIFVLLRELFVAKGVLQAELLSLSYGFLGDRQPSPLPPTEVIRHKLDLPLVSLGSTRTPNGLWYNFIELPYHGESISMLIALPTESSTPLSAIIPHITTKTIDSWMNTMVPKRMQLVLPK
jgi:hypothetical protein